MNQFIEDDGSGPGPVGSSGISSYADVSDRPPRRYGEVQGHPGLFGWARVFFGFGGPRVLSSALTVGVIRRLRMGRWRWSDAAVAGLVVALHPFAEWAVHVHILHRKACRREKDQVEPYAARMHRLHHEDPKNIDLVLLPMRSVRGLVGTTGMLTVLARDQRRGASAGVAALSSLLAYEWVHFLIHSPHRPRRAMYRARWRAHRLHHYRNERYWFGVVGTVADRVFGTAPERGDVPVSPTARSLTPVQ